MMGFGRSLELFFVDGRPDGMLTAQVFNWTGHVLKAPRTQIRQALDRPEARHTGLYVLLGRKEDSPVAYIGEAEVIAERIKTHDLNREWWNDLILISTSANELNKAHIKYLESRMIALARTAKTYTLDNVNQPTTTKLSEAAIANMEEFLDTLMLVLSAIGVGILVDKTITPFKASAPDPVQASPFFVLTSRKHGIDARARVIGEGFVVLKGSQARLKWEGKEKAANGYRFLHEKLVRDDVIDVSGMTGVFKSDYAFASPSAASAVVLGRTSNGQLEWVTEDAGQSYGAWEKAGLA